MKVMLIGIMTMTLYSTCRAFEVVAVIQNADRLDKKSEIVYDEDLLQLRLIKYELGYVVYDSIIQTPNNNIVVRNEDGLKLPMKCSDCIYMNIKRSTISKLNRILVEQYATMSNKAYRKFTLKIKKSLYWKLD